MGKSMLAKALAELLTGKADRLPGITTFAVPKSARDLAFSVEMSKKEGK